MFSIDFREEKLYAMVMIENIFQLLQMFYSIKSINSQSAKVTMKRKTKAKWIFLKKGKRFWTIWINDPNWICSIFISKEADMEIKNAIMVLTWVNGIAKPTIIQLCQWPMAKSHTTFQTNLFNKPELLVLVTRIWILLGTNLAHVNYT